MGEEYYDMMDDDPQVKHMVKQLFELHGDNKTAVKHQLWELGFGVGYGLEGVEKPESDESEVESDDSDALRRELEEEAEIKRAIAAAEAQAAAELEQERLKRQQEEEKLRKAEEE